MSRSINFSDLLDEIESAHAISNAVNRYEKFRAIASLHGIPVAQVLQIYGIYYDAISNSNQEI